METAKQFSVQLANKPGRFAAILSSLTKEKVTIRALLELHEQRAIRVLLGVVDTFEFHDSLTFVVLFRRPDEAKIGTDHVAHAAVDAFVGIQHG